MQKRQKNTKAHSESSFMLLCYTEQVSNFDTISSINLCVWISDFVGQLKHEILIKIKRDEKKAIIDFNEMKWSSNSHSISTKLNKEPKPEPEKKESNAMNTRQTTPAEDMKTNLVWQTQINHQRSFSSFHFCFQVFQSCTQHGTMTKIRRSVDIIWNSDEKPQSIQMQKPC